MCNMSTSLLAACAARSGTPYTRKSGSSKMAYQSAQIRKHWFGAVVVKLPCPWKVNWHLEEWSVSSNLWRSFPISFFVSIPFVSIDKNQHPFSFLVLCALWVPIRIFTNSFLFYPFTFLRLKSQQSTLDWGRLSSSEVCLFPQSPLFDSRISGCIKGIFRFLDFSIHRWSSVLSPERLLSFCLASMPVRRPSLCVWTRVAAISISSLMLWLSVWSALLARSPEACLRRRSTRELRWECSPRLWIFSTSCPPGL